MRIFNLSKEYNVVCNSENTRYGFRHLATLHKNGFAITKGKICYYNRTWERFEYESILLQIINDNFKDAQKTKFINKINNIAY